VTVEHNDCTVLRVQDRVSRGLAHSKRRRCARPITHDNWDDCHEAFRVFSGRIFTFAGKVTDPKQSERQPPPIIPNALTPFLTSRRLHAVDSSGVIAHDSSSPTDVDFEVIDDLSEDEKWDGLAICESDTNANSV
jgi:hypothetical protein